MSKPPTIHTLDSLKARCIEEGDCWLWQGFSANGAPMVHHQGGMVPVRRLMQALAGKPVRKGYYVATCGDKRCVCPDHTVLRRPAEHMRSMAQKLPQSLGNARRIARITASARSRAKLTLDDARAARASTDPCDQVAQRLGVHPSLVARIRRGEQWRDHANPFGGLL